MDRRRIILIAAFFLFVVGVVVAVYFLFFRGTIIPTPQGNENVNAGGLPSTNVNTNSSVVNTNTGGVPTTNGSVNAGTNIGNRNVSPTADGGITQVQTIVGTTVAEPLLNTQSNRLVYYDPITDKFYEADPDGANPRELSDQLFPDAQSIEWSNNGDKAIVTFPDQSKIVYDFTGKKQYSLPKEAEGFSFAPDGTKIAYKYLPSDVEDRWLVAANIDGSGVKFLEPIGEEAPDVEVNWSPKGDIVATYRKSIDSNRQEIIFIGQNKENFKSAVTEGRGFTGSWSPNGEQLLYSVYSPESNYNPQLYIVNGSGDAIGSGRTSLDLATWPDKCTFGTSSTIIYCAVPQFLPSGSGFFPEQSTSSNDDFYEINVATGQKRLLAQPSSGISANNLFFSSDGKRLYFRDAKTGYLQSILLP